MTPPILRFAPSPNGLMHLGHALSALLNAEAARRLGGRFLIRIEDLDQVRSTEANITRINEDLAWIGVRSDEPPRRQSAHLHDYRGVLQRLIEAGLVYRCFASRGEIAQAVAGRPDWPRDPDGSPLYPGLWRGAPSERIEAALSQGLPFAWRLDMAKALKAVSGELSWQEAGAGPSGETGTIPADPAAWGDVILARKDAPTSYHLAVVLDDAVQRISHIVRGQDLFYATAIHVVLRRLFGLPEPHYHHHRLILGPDGRKLSKSRGSESLRSLREAGATPSDILRLIAWNPDRDLAGLA